MTAWPIGFAVRVASAAISIGPYAGADQGTWEESALRDRFSLGLVSTVQQALERAVLPGISSESDVALIVNSVYSTFENVEYFLHSLLADPPVASPRLFPNTSSSVSAGKIAEAVGLTGPVLTLCSSSPFPIALEWLRGGQAAAVIIAAGETISPMLSDCLARSGARFFPDSPARYVESFSAAILARSRTGEDASTAILGCGSAVSSTAARREDAMFTAASDALKSAGVQASDVTGVIMGTAMQEEANAVTRLIGLLPDRWIPCLEIGNLLGTAPLISLSMLCESVNSTSTFELGGKIDLNGKLLLNSFFVPATFTSLVVDRE